MPYSQNNEEEIILAEFKRLAVDKGRFLDIGAWEGKGFSNTYRLAELGWRGVCVEPSPSAFSGLIKNHADHPLITLVNAAVAQSARLVEWYDSNGDAISTTSIPHKTKWEVGWKVKFTQFFVYTLPIITLFDHFGYDFDFINIDVESTNLDLFVALPWPRIKDKTKVICIEHDGHYNDMDTFAAQYGYHPVAVNHENLILSK